MEKNPFVYKKMLIIGIIILFVGAGVLPNISGHDKSSKISLPMESNTCAFLNDDFLKAYWKFDECSGDTVEDSSNNNYDGTRYGASWTSNGYSGCALDFDGIDDYVDLDLHAAKIGVNKTDDFIISFNFNSTSNENGVIFSNRGYDNKPEMIVELQFNGRLSFKLWTHCKCGLIVLSDAGYNDGLWHSVDIFYNGISLEPTILMLIDNDLKANLTDWICNIQSSNFSKAAIGKLTFFNSYFFNGMIDEFKFIKYDGGNDQGIPIIDGLKIGKPNIEYEYDFTTYDPEEDDIWIQIDWGDGEITDWLGPYESGETATVSHIWTEEDDYIIRARSKDIWDESPWSNEGYEVSIGNQPPDKPEVSGPLYGDPGKDLTYSFISYDLEGQDIYYIVDWDDGTTTESDFVNSNTTIELSHIWDKKNDYNITARVIDIKGKESELSDPIWIRIGDKPPRRPNINGPIRGQAGLEIDFNFIADDPENDIICYNIRWGDGEEIPETDWYPSGLPITISHIWNSTGSYTIKARAKDKFEYWSDWTNFDVTIPRTRTEILSFIRFLEHFPLLERLLSLISVI